jgi:hypothetical protein
MADAADFFVRIVSAVAGACLLEALADAVVA